MFVREDLPELVEVHGGYKIRNQTVSQLNGCVGVVPKPPVVAFWEEQQVKLGVINDTPDNAIWTGSGITDLRKEMYSAQSAIRMQEDLDRKNREIAELRAFITQAIVLAKTI